jgi:cell division protein FtsI (penicillin-binding protein 3)
VPETLIHSSNIVSAQIADQLGSRRMKQVMADLGFNERPYIELPRAASRSGAAANGRG